MCKGHDCPLKDKCFRHTAKPESDWQSYFDGAYDEATEQCEYFRDNQPGKSLARWIDRFDEDEEEDV